METGKNRHGTIVPRTSSSSIALVSNGLFYEYFGPDMSCLDLCLDVKEGSGQINQNPYVIVKELQVWECTDNNDNQIFFELPYPNK